MAAPKRSRDGRKPTKQIGSAASENADTMPPVFALDRMQEGSGYSVTCCNHDHQAAAMRRLFMLSRMTWSEIQNAPRHGLGTEKLPRTAIKAAIPASVTEDVTFLALRYHGKSPMVGYRDGRTFHVLYLDHNFSLYEH
jgi:hypothetical protein